MVEQDGELVDGAKRGCLDCFGKLYNRYYPAIATLAFSLLGDRHLAEDVAQETFAVACRDLHHLKSSEKFAAWCAGICRNVAKQTLRTRKEIITTEFAPATTEPKPDDQLSQAIRDAINHLAASDREIIILRYYNDLSYEQMSAMLGISEQAVHGRLTRAKQKIEKILKQKGMVSENEPERKK